jgi:uncharacterized protein (DUF2252 family)
MAQSAHAYVRGSTAQFYQWLEASEGKVPDGPPVWICGDCHVGNLGPLADARGKVAIQIRDVDQTVIGNPAHDLIRLGLSLASAVRGSDLPGVTTARMIEAMMAGYEAALASDYTAGPPRTRKSTTVKAILRRSVRRRWRHLAHERLRDMKPAIPLGDRFWAPTAKERAALDALFAGDAIRGMLTKLQGREAMDEIALLDAAYWVKGCSSLGRLRYAALLRVGERDLCLVDIKEATPTAAPRAAGAKMPRDDAERVLAGARALSPHLGERMIAARLLDRPVIIRELMPQDLKLGIDHLSPEEAMAIASYLANVVGRAHGRQMSLADRQAWLAQLSRGRGDLDAPPWLWRSVVELLSIHEAEYLDHCRRYALAAA